MKQRPPRTHAKCKPNQFSKSTLAQSTAAVQSIRRLAAKIKNKTTIEELIAEKHAGHKY